MAFGILVQKFDLFLRTASESLAARALPAGSQIVCNIAGLLLIVLGGVVMAFAAIRFRETTRDIDAEEVRPGPGERLDITLVALRLLLGGSCSSIWCTREPAGSELGAAIGSELRRRYRRCRSLEGSRIVDRECQVFGRLRCGGHQAHPVRRLETVPRPLRNDDHHPCLQRMGLRPVIGHDVEGHRTVDDLHDLVSVRVALPWALA